MANLNLENVTVKRKRKSNPFDFKHGLARTRLYNIFKKMKERCYSPTCDSYKYYGARGIIICNEWLNDFTSFYVWAYAHGYADNLTIDRILTDGNYEPSNCRWATPKEQGNNRRDCRYVTFNGVTKSFADWCKVYNIKLATAKKRLQSGWSSEMALTIPPGSVKLGRKSILTLEKYSKCV